LDFTDVTRDFILEHVSEEEIFDYFGLPVLTYKFRNPYRVDKKATCQFYRSNTDNRLRMHDWTKWFHGDCFDWVMFRESLSFNDALHLIANAFNLLDSKTKVHRTPTPTILIEAKNSDIKVKRRGWLDIDREFWGRWDFKRETINFYQVRPLTNVWLSDLQIYQHQADNPAYVYWFGGNDYKVYFPYATKGSRFLHTNPNILQGYDQLPETGAFLVITKSLKDAMKLYEYGIAAIAPMSESQIIPPEMYMHLSRRFKRIFSLYDYDYVGVHSMQKMKKLYGITPLYFMPPQPKDFTDFYEANGDEETNLLIETIKSNYL